MLAICSAMLFASDVPLSCVDVELLKLGHVFSLHLSVCVHPKQCCWHVFACTHLVPSHHASLFMYSIGKHIEHLYCISCALLLSTWQCIARRLYPLPIMLILLKPVDQVNSAIASEHVNA